MRPAPVFRSRGLAWALLAPTLAVLLLFLYYPAIQAFVLSLYRSNLFLGTRRFIGVDNYVALYQGPLSGIYRQVLGQSLLFSALVVVMGLAAGLALASLAKQPVRCARIYRTLLIWPFALSPAVAATIFAFMFNPEVGFVNQVLSSAFGIRPRWLDTPHLAFGLVVLATVWKNLGYNVVFYLAALQNVPRELGEAAEIDGANGWQRFRAITWPMLGPTTFFLVFTNLTYSFFDTFGLIDILTKGGPIGAPPFDRAGVTTVLAYRLVQDGFGGGGNLGFAAAQGVVMLTLVAIVTVLQFRFGQRRVHYGGE